MQSFLDRFNLADMFHKAPLHIVNGSSRMRAELSRLVYDIGHHAEVYGEVEELAERPPREGIILLGDEESGESIEARFDELSEAQIWLPVLVLGLSPTTQQVVAAIKAGALQYLPLPLTQRQLAAFLEQIHDEALAYAEAKRRMIEARSRISKLSRREREVLDWLSEGSSNKVIARELEISPRTVEIHRANMMAKLEASHPADAVRLRLEAGLGQGRKQAAQG